LPSRADSMLWTKGKDSVSCSAFSFLLCWLEMFLNKKKSLDFLVSRFPSSC
jgi:hypothetical protein